MTGSPARDEFPHLTAASLYAADTHGDGNCLFHALSDQLHGDQTHSARLRTAVVTYMREHADDYKPFLAAAGDDSRKPKRKNPGALHQAAPTPEAVDSQFERHLENMARGGTYGDHMEIQAFARAYGVDVKIWHYNEQTWLLRSRHDVPANRVLHIAYHEWQHYSSVRNVHGPHTGLPNVRETTAGPLRGAYSNSKSPGSTILLEPWKLNVVLSSLPYPASNEAVHRALRRSGGDVGDAVSYLIEKEERRSLPSTPGSSSVEREPDDDDEGENAGRAKRPSQARLGVETRRTKKTLARKLRTAAGSSQDSSASSPNPSRESFTPPPSDSSGTHSPQVVISTGEQEAGPVDHGAGGKSRPATGKPSASATRDMKKRAQKEAAKERKKEQAAAKAAGPRTGQPGVPTKPFQTLEI